MSGYVSIYGTSIKLPEKPRDETIENFGLDRSEQKWRRGALPEIFDKVDYNKEGKLILTKEQSEYAENELKKCREGFWIFIGGIARYITGRYYFYLKYYILEDGNAPEFREADRLYFLFWQHWFSVLWCLGIVRIKKRRQGASSQSCSNILYEAIFYRNSNCGLLSKTRDDSKATFTEMITNAYQLLPVFFKQRLAGKEDSVTELVLLHDKGANSKISYKAPVLNAFDRGRMSYVLLDEGGKYPLDVPVSRLLAIISKTLSKGVKRVGWLDAPSTVNELTKGGGAEYKKIFDSANQFKKKPTTNRLVRFFQPAYEAYEGFIDEFGDSVIDVPTLEQYSYLVNKWVMKSEDGELISELSEDDIKLGAKVYVTVKRRDGLSGTDLEEEIRMNPCDEEEAFMYAGQGCEFNAANIQKQIKEEEESPSYWRKIRLGEKKEMKEPAHGGAIKEIHRTIFAMDDDKSGLKVLEFPNKENHFENFGDDTYSPLNTHLYQIGVDTTQDERIAEHGSNPAIVVMKKSCMVTIEGQQVETGMYPVAIYDDKTRMDVHFDDIVRMLCMWYGCKVAYEMDRRTDYIRFFREKGCLDFLSHTSSIMINPAKKKPVELGHRSGDPFQLIQMLQINKWYIDGDSLIEYNGHVHRIKYVPLLKQLLKYDHSDRGTSDLVVAMQQALCAMFGEMKAPALPAQVIKLFPEYAIRKYF